MKDIKYHNRKSATISLEMSFIGLGLMGNRFVKQVSELKNPQGSAFYSTLGINTNEGDLKSCKVVNQLFLSGYKGAGRDPQIGYKALMENKKQVQSAFVNIAKSSDITWIVAGLGGGTGTGSILCFVEWAIELKQHLGINYGIIISVPRDIDNDIEKKNALLVLNAINDAIDNIPIIIINNEKEYENAIKNNHSSSWLHDANASVIEVLHQMNIISNMVPETAHLDGEELKRILSKGGIISLQRRNVFIEDLQDKDQTLNIFKNEDSTPYYVGVQIVAPKSLGKVAFSPATLQHLESLYAKNSNAFWGTYLDNNNDTKKIDVFTVLSGMGLPKFVENLKNMGNAPNKIEKLDLSFSQTDTEPYQRSTSISNPFASSNENASSSKNDLPSWLYE